MIECYNLKISVIFQII